MTSSMGREFGSGEKDVGGAGVQIALLTKRIEGLKKHFEKHTYDYSSNRGLLRMIGRRRALSRYLQKKRPQEYQTLIQKLGLRK